MCGIGFISIKCNAHHTDWYFGVEMLDGNSIGTYVSHTPSLGLRRIRVEVYGWQQPTCNNSSSFTDQPCRLSTTFSIFLLVLQFMTTNNLSLHLWQKNKQASGFFMQTLKLQAKITNTQATSNKQQTSMEVRWKCIHQGSIWGKNNNKWVAKGGFRWKSRNKCPPKGKQASSKQPYNLILNVVYMVP